MVQGLFQSSLESELPLTIASHETDSNMIPTTIKDEVLSPQHETKVYWELQTKFPNDAKPENSSLPPIHEIWGNYHQDYDMKSWTTRSPQSWDSNQTLDFVHFVILESDSIETNFGGCNFKVPGHVLCSMTEEEFIQRDSVYGQFIYETLQKLLNNCDFTVPNDHNTELLDEIDPYILSEEISIGGIFNEQTSYKTLCDLELETFNDQCYQSEKQSLSSMQTSPDICPEPMSTEDLASSFMYEAPWVNLPNPIIKEEVTQRRGPGRPRKERSAPSEPRPKGRRGRKKGQMAKGNHLYEFLMDLLRHPYYEPSHVCWLKPEEGIFKIVQSEKVAKLWGLKKKNKREMCYEKLSRAMRFCRDVGFFKKIDGAHRFPRKLVFQFGEKANWHSALTHAVEQPRYLEDLRTKILQNTA